MQDKSKKILFEAIDNSSELRCILKYVFVCDRALGFAEEEDLFSLQEDEISGMNYIKDIVLDKYLALENDLNSLHDSIK
jgi:hypothetical protein